MLEMQNGGNAIAYSWAFIKAAEYFEPDCIQADTTAIKYGQVLWQLQYEGEGNRGAAYVGNAEKSSMLAAIGDSWNSDTTSTDKGIYGNTNDFDNHTFYLLLWEILQNKASQYQSLDLILNQINGAPYDGTFKYSDSVYAEDGGRPLTVGGFQTIDQNGGDTNGFLGNFNGLDFMFFYNLYCLASSSVHTTREARSAIPKIYYSGSNNMALNKKLMYQSFPDPGNGEMKVKYFIPGNKTSMLEISDCLGRKLQSIEPQVGAKYN